MLIYIFKLLALVKLKAYLKDTINKILSNIIFFIYLYSSFIYLYLYTLISFIYTLI